MKIAMIDNYDSFTYNLVHLVKELGAEVTVFRNDQFALSDLESFDKIMLSPGLCLGEQAIGEVFGGNLVNLDEVFHGVQTPAHIVDFVEYGEHKVDYLFRGLHRDILVGRYHSWVVDAETMPDCLEVTCTSNEGQVMALRHREYDVRGIQFHPESVLTPDGKKIINNWLLHL